MNWTFYQNFSDCPTAHLYKILKLRQDIFIIEQNCIYDDIDGLDYASSHLLLWDSHEELVGYLRIVPAGVKFAEPSLGRIAIRKENRGKGLGKKLIGKGISIAEKLDSSSIKIEAQAHLENYYAELGFEKTSEMYDVDDIPHLQMVFLSGTESNRQ